MAKEDESSLSRLLPPWPAMAAIVVAALTYGIASKPFRTPRIPDPQPDSSGENKSRSIPARLWQDPFANLPTTTATLSLENEIKSVFDSFESHVLPRGSSRSLAEHEPWDVLFALDYVSAPIVPDSAELRRRERYAALSAMGSAGYIPVSSDKLEYFYLPTGTPRSSAPAATEPSRKDQKGQADSPPPLVVPFQWFKERPLSEHHAQHQSSAASPDAQKAAKKVRAVCLLWITHDSANSDSWKSLCNIIPAIHAQAHAHKAIGQTQFALTGRIDSDGLLKFLRPQENASPPVPWYETLMSSFTARPTTPHLPVALYVANSTVEHVRKDLIPGRMLNTTTGDWPVRPCFVIGTDRELAESLIDELKLRHIHVGTPNNDIAILSEWDTQYGRRMVPTFQNAIQKDQASTGYHSVVGDPTPFHLFHYTYLRGLDGKRPDEKKPNSEGQTSKQADKSQSDNKETTTSIDGEGEKQVDYLKRIVDRMKAERIKFRAIGLLGNDVYDKLLLLQALRSSFPEAQFFTTDYDVRLLQPGDFHYTHNLLIASHFGNTLRYAFQKDIPPFRCDYDAASYLSYLMALNYDPELSMYPNDLANYIRNKWSGWIGDGSLEFDLRIPRIYEVGRSGAYPMTFRNNHLVSVSTPRERTWEERRTDLLWLGFCLLLVVMLLMPFSKAFRKCFTLVPMSIWRRELPEDRSAMLYVLWTWGAVSLIALLGAVIYWSHFHDQEEPFELQEGLSVWPKEILRLTAFLLSIVFILQARRRLARRNSRIKDFYKIKSVKAQSVTTGEFLRSEWKASFDMWFHWDSEETDLEKAWRNFSRYGKFRRRMERCAILTLMAVLIYLSVPVGEHLIHSHARGQLAFVVDLGLRFLSGIGLAVLIVFVIDCTFASYRFVKQISSFLPAEGGHGKPEKQVRWPSGVLNEAAKLHGLDPRSPGPVATAGLELWLLLHLIDDVTRDVSDMIYKPFLVLTILVLAQCSIFESWYWDYKFLCIILATAGGAICCALMLQKANKAAKRKAISRLDWLIKPLIGDKDGSLHAKLNQIRSDIEHLRSGAFGSLDQNPVIRAVLIPLTGGGGLAAIEALLARQ